MIAQDFVALDRLLGEELVYTHSVGTSDTKTTFLGSLKSGKFRFKSALRDELQVRYFSTTAILHGRVALTVDVGGTEHVARNAFVTVWEKREAWQLVHWQSTPLK
jgi:hypothetical protein